MAGNLAKGALQTITGNIETAQLIIHDYREVAKSSGVGQGGLSMGDALKALSNERVAATMSALTSGTAPSYPSSRDLTFKVQFNPSQLTLNASSIPRHVKDVTSDKTRSLAVEDPKLVLTVILYFDDMDAYDSFTTGTFTSGASATGIANAVKLGADVVGVRKKPSVQPEVESLVAALRNPFTRTISFRWADFSFIGQLSTVQARYTMFSTSGRPVRAQVLLRMQHEVDPVMLHGWYDDFDTAFRDGSGALGKAGRAVEKIFNLNL